MLDKVLIDTEYGFLGDTIHVNCCSVGVPPLRVQRVCQDFLSGEYMDLVMNRLPDGYEPQRQRTRQKLAQLICADAANIAFTASTAEGLAILAAGYPLGPGDNVVTTDLENPAGLLPWINARDNRGFELRIVRTQNGCVSADELMRAADRNTKILCLSAVQYGTGFLSDLAEIGRRCRSRGILFAVDAIQAVGRIPIDVESMDIDYLSCGGFKALAASFGVGFVFCTPAVRQTLRPVYAGAASTPRFPTAPAVFTPDYSLKRYGDARALETGSHNTFGIRMLEESTDLLLHLGIDNIHAHITSLESQLRTALRGVSLDVPAPPEKNRSGIVVATYPEGLYAEVNAILARYNIILTSRPGYIRLALNSYNTAEHVQRIAEALRTVACLCAA
ncbi:MAG TPA: aminotransferase class V-fold PLP-dependent enzyme [Candidatus Ventrousia excrementavium]|uniref:Aminotransferase class V-fold PLP-dependent enzyme n=1 Tax=Candidatus Ventrousia excrementavium TaxID=2840961 RepID=A0A9D1IUT9_9CLOT|nr:aminotransferase class V-fold PLP-dependent enzyme [Candidatus Ventrousia excrementavium]